jgi:protein-disulfide isomerase
LTLIRRLHCLGIAALAAVALALGALPAPAQTLSPVDLLQPGPLGDRQLGPDGAPVTIIEYASMTCPHCANFHKNTFPELKKRYIDTGKVRYIFREFVLNPLDAGAVMLARCLDKDKYFDFVDVLFRKQDEWVVQRPIEPLFAIARQAGFTKETFEACLKNQEILSGIEAQRNRAAERFGVNSTPTLIINGKVVRGSLSIDELAKHIEPLLKG